MFNLVPRNSLTFYVFKTTLIHRTFHRSLSSSSSSSAALASDSKLVKFSPIDNSFTVSYLIDSCGFPPEKAISASQFLNFKTPDKPDSVKAFFRNQGFTETQISQLIQRFPRTLNFNPQKNLLPKFEFLTSIGLSTSDIAKLVTARPKSLASSLKNRLEPSINLLKDLLQSDDRTVIAIKRCAWVLDSDFESNMIPNMQLLRDAGVPGAKMLYVLTYQPRDFLVSTEQFKKVVDEVIEMGFDPTKTKFMLAVHAIRSMTKSTWDKKIETYNKWGLSKAEILLAFKADPWFMMNSGEKIDTAMEFLVNKMGFEASVVAKNSLLIALSMEKRILPRHYVYEYCVNKGLLKGESTQSSFRRWLKYPETVFIEKLERYEKEVPGVVKLYQERVDRVS